MYGAGAVRCGAVVVLVVPPITSLSLAITGPDGLTAASPPPPRSLPSCLPVSRQQKAFFPPFLFGSVPADSSAATTVSSYQPTTSKLCVTQLLVALRTPVLTAFWRQSYVPSAVAGPPCQPAQEKLQQPPSRYDVTYTTTHCRCFIFIGALAWNPVVGLPF